MRSKERNHQRENREAAWSGRKGLSHPANYLKLWWPFTELQEDSVTIHLSKLNPMQFLSEVGIITSPAIGKQVQEFIVT